MAAAEILLCDLTHDYQTVATNKIPLGIGMIAAYAIKENPNIKIKLFKRIQKLDAYLRWLLETNFDGAVLVSFSNFIWNQKLNLSVAKIIKTQFPQVIILFGGPNFALNTLERKEFLRQNEVIDFYIPYEGEMAFSYFLNTAEQASWNVQKIKENKPTQSVYLLENLCIETEVLPRLDIKKIPSPYLTHLFDEFLGTFKPLVQFTRGCPFKCAYCSEGMGHWTKVYRRTVEEVDLELEYIATKCDSNETLHIADSNFGMYQADIEYANSISDKRKRYQWPKSILVATGKNSKETVISVARILEGQMPLSVSVQSTDSEVLNNVKRKNIRIDDIFAVGLSAKELDANTYADIILALPGDSINAHKKSIQDVVNADVDFTTPFQFMLLKGTDLASYQSIEKYGMVSRFRVLPRCFGKYKLLNQDFVAVEIEEICIANRTLSFEDYIESRRLHLLIDAFYNHRVFDQIYQILKELGIQSYIFLETLHNSDKGVIENVFEAFVEETKNELWDNEEALHNFVSRDENILRFKSGELGANLIYKYRIIMLMEYSCEMIDFAFNRLLWIINHRDDINYKEVLPFIEQLKKFMLCRISPFLDTAKQYTLEFNYDFLQIGKIPLLQIIQQNRRTVIHFDFEKEYRDVIDYYKKEEGESFIGVSKILSQINMKKCFRSPSYEYIHNENSVQ